MTPKWYRSYLTDSRVPGTIKPSKWLRIRFPDPETAKQKKNRKIYVYVQRILAWNIRLIHAKITKPGGQLSAQEGASEHGLKTTR